MLKMRVISAAVLAPVVTLSVLYMPHQWFVLFLALIALAGCWEWACMVVKGKLAKITYVLVCAALMAGAWYLMNADHVRLAMLAAGLYWVFIVLLLPFYQPSWPGNYLLASFLHYSGYFVMVLGWLAMVNLHQQQPSLLLFLFVLIWVADISAYFAGKRFGRYKLAPELSPGKTREGVFGAIIGAVLVSILGIVIWKEQLTWLLGVYFVLLCIFSTLISIIGDLFESLLKRNAGVKDSGHLIPGHGGVLDRIDSLLAASPGFLLGLYWLY